MSCIKFILTSIHFLKPKYYLRQPNHSNNTKYYENQYVKCVFTVLMAGRYFSLPKINYFSIMQYSSEAFIAI